MKQALHKHLEGLFLRLFLSRLFPKKQEPALQETRREAVGKNMAYTVALAGHKEKPEAKDVIAVDILDNGDVLVYFKK